ncbi:hypothetical protein ACFL1H_00690 [Nanoarchaeota archaeon]
MNMRSHHKTYETIIKTTINNGFNIVGYKDPRPIAGSRKMAPNEYDKFSKLPIFSVWKLQKIK